MEIRKTLLGQKSYRFMFGIVTENHELDKNPLYDICTYIFIFES